MVSEQFDPPACSLPSLPRFVDSSSRSVAPAIPMATAPSPFPTFPSVTPLPQFCFGAPPYAPYPFPYPNQPPPPSPSYHAAAYHHHHRFQLPPPSHPNPHWHQGMQQMQPPPPAPGNPWHPHHAAAQPPPPSSPPPRRPPPSSPASTGPAVLGSTTAAPLVGNTTTSPSAEARVPAEASISKNMPRAILDLKRRLDEQQARDRTSFDKLKGELEKLTSMAAQLATFIGKHTTAAIPGSSPLEVTCTAPIAPKVYDTMPTPSSGYDNFSVHSDQSPAVQDGGTNPREQNLDELPQAYGLHNLNCRTVVRADGTEHSYYALPGDYPLERATPESLFSKESVGVFASKPGQQPHQIEQQDSEQLLTCISKATASEQSGAYLNYISGVPDYTLEQQQNDDEKTPANLQQLRPTVVSIFSLGTDQKPDTKLCVQYVKPQISNQQRNTQMTEAAIKEWDPGDPQTIMDLPAVVKWSSLEGLTHAVIFPPKILLSMNVYAAKSIPNILVSLPLYIQWDPGDTKYHALFTTAAGATKLQCVDIYKPTMVQILAVQFRARKVPIFESVMMCSYPFGLGRTEVNIQQLRDPSFKVLVPHASREEWDLGDHSILSSTLNKDIAGRIFTLPYVPLAKIQFGVPTCVPKQSCYCRVPSSNENHEVQFLWEPGILNQMVTRLEETAVANPVHSMQTLFKLFFFIEQPVGLKFWTQLCHSWCSTPVFLQELHVPMIKTNNCTSTSIGVASSEYTYIVDFLPDQWEFLHRPDVQKNCNAKNLLLSESYLRTWEMDIIFITFLPP